MRGAGFVRTDRQSEVVEIYDRIRQWDKEAEEALTDLDGALKLASACPVEVVVQEKCTSCRTMLLSSEEKVSVGRSPRCKILMLDPHVSAEHLTLFRDDRLFLCVEVLGRTGCWLNRTFLRQGDVAALRLEDCLAVGKHPCGEGRKEPYASLQIWRASSAERFELKDLVSTHRLTGRQPAIDSDAVDATSHDSVRFAQQEPEHAAHRDHERQLPEQTIECQQGVAALADACTPSESEHSWQTSAWHHCEKQHDEERQSWWQSWQSWQSWDSRGQSHGSWESLQQQPGIPWTRDMPEQKRLCESAHSQLEVREDQWKERKQQRKSQSQILKDIELQLDSRLDKCRARQQGNDAGKLPAKLSTPPESMLSSPAAQKPTPPPPVPCSYARNGCMQFLSLREVACHEEACDFRTVPCSNAAHGCQKILLARDREAHAQLCNFKKLDCEFARNGCSAQPLRRDYLQHVQDCPKRPVPCANASRGCSETLLACNSSEHEKTCQFRLVACANKSKGCRQVVLACEAEGHAQRCDFRPVPCMHAAYGCRKLLLARDDNAHAAVCERRPVPCEHAANGCKEQPAWEDREAHAQSCGYRRVDCENAGRGCQEIVLACIAQKHAKECQFRGVLCQYSRQGCRQVVLACEAEGHAQRCDFRPVPCMHAAYGCRKLLLARDANAHATVCERRPVPCEHAANGCKEQPAWEDREAHAQSCSYREVLSVFSADALDSGAAQLNEVAVALPQVASQREKTESTGMGLHHHKQQRRLGCSFLNDWSSAHGQDYLHQVSRHTPRPEEAPLSANQVHLLVSPRHKQCRQELRSWEQQAKSLRQELNLREERRRSRSRSRSRHPQHQLPFPQAAYSGSGETDSRKSRFSDVSRCSRSNVERNETEQLTSSQVKQEGSLEALQRQRSQLAAKATEKRKADDAHAILAGFARRLATPMNCQMSDGEDNLFQAYR